MPKKISLLLYEGTKLRWDWEK